MVSPLISPRKTVFFIALVVIVCFLWWVFFWTVENPCQEGGYWDVEAGTCIYPMNHENPTLPPTQTGSGLMLEIGGCREGEAWDMTKSACVPAAQ